MFYSYILAVVIVINVLEKKSFIFENLKPNVWINIILMNNINSLK